MRHTLPSLFAWQCIAGKAWSVRGSLPQAVDKMVGRRASPLPPPLPPEPRKPGAMNLSLSTHYRCSTHDLPLASNSCHDQHLHVPGRHKNVAAHLL